MLVTDGDTEQFRTEAGEEISCPYFSFNCQNNSLLILALKQVNLLRVNISYFLKKSKIKKPHSFSTEGQMALSRTETGWL